MAVLDRVPEVSPAQYRRITRWALWSLVFIVVTGAAVRLTESGLGCSSWPGCEPGQFVPHGESSLNPWIEFANRLVTGAVSVAVALAVLGSLRRVPRRRDLTVLSWGLVAGVVGQILLGALVVKLEVHPIVVQGHFLLSAILVADAVVLHHRAQRPDGPDGRPAPAQTLVEPPLVRLAAAAVVLGACVMLAGTVVTGSGPHSGDAAAERLDLSVRAVAMVHSGLTWIFLAVVAALALGLRRVDAPTPAVDAATALLVVVVLQGGLGYLQYVTGVPELLVGLHVLGSMLVWVAALRLLLTLREPRPDARLAAEELDPPAVAASRV
jgi:cytochrome c oxidase assembly protein subunit 15